ncbi:MAG: metallophosphoesterase [Planctomycetota bacterium]
MIIEWMLILIGHLSLCCVLFNNVHAFAIPSVKKSRKITEKLIAAAAVIPLPLLIYASHIKHTPGAGPLPTTLHAYLVLVQATGIYFIARWIYRKLTNRLPNNAKLLATQVIDVEEELGKSVLVSAKARLLGYVPGNQVAKICTESWEFSFAELPTSLDGFKICHLSDLHFTGGIDQSYFNKMVEIANQSGADMIVISGDLLDTDECLPWIEEILFSLSAPRGVFVIRGNHDLMVIDQKQYDQILETGPLQLASNGKWNKIEIDDAVLFLAGNDLPWYRKPMLLRRRPVARANEFRLLLAHSPDQIGWAVRHDFDLVLAGHTHGGQIRLPIVGPIIAPSRYGIKYASGTFKIRQTMMHVSRGISGDEPIRINCLPEISVITLKSQQVSAQRT